jgi:hypothetical protein
MDIDISKFTITKADARKKMEESMSPLEQKIIELQKYKSEIEFNLHCLMIYKAIDIAILQKVIEIDHMVNDLILRGRVRDFFISEGYVTSSYANGQVTIRF